MTPANSEDVTRAKDIMSSKPITILEGTSIEQAIKLMVNNKITGLPIVDQNGRMMGVVSEYDVLTQIAETPAPNQTLFQKPVQFSKQIETVDTETPLTEIVSRFLKSKFRRLPVLNQEGNLVGIITRRDLMRLYYYRSKLPEL